MHIVDIIPASIKDLFGAQTTSFISTEASPFIETFSGAQTMYGLDEAGDIYLDLPQLRRQSVRTFSTSLYGRGIISRIITNEIHTGLELDARPFNKYIGLTPEEVDEWQSDVEDRFHIWACTNKCHIANELNFYQLQVLIRFEALVKGDVLVIERIDPSTHLPVYQIVAAESVTGGMLTDIGGDVQLSHGVEFTSNGTHIAYWIQEDGKFESTRIPAYTEGGRRQAWLVYGSPRRIGSVRGEPLFTTVFQSLSELEKYRDSVQRRASIQSMMAIFIERTDVATSGFSAEAINVRHGRQALSPPADPSPTKYGTAKWQPGMVVERLEKGEKPVPFGNTASDLQFKDFEQAIISALAWAHEIPPEILQLSFNSNYSASQAALNELNYYLDKVRDYMGTIFCQHVYEEFLVGSVIRGDVSADGLLLSVADDDFLTFGAWTYAEWTEAVKVTTDLRKVVQACNEAVNGQLMTRERAMKLLGFGKFRREALKMRQEAALVKGIMDDSPWLNPAASSSSNTTDTPDTTDTTDTDEDGK